MSMISDLIGRRNGYLKEKKELEDQLLALSGSGHSVEKAAKEKQIAELEGDIRNDNSEINRLETEQGVSNKDPIAASQKAADKAAKEKKLEELRNAEKEEEALAAEKRKIAAEAAAKAAEEKKNTAEAAAAAASERKAAAVLTAEKASKAVKEADKAVVEANTAAKEAEKDAEEAEKADPPNAKAVEEATKAVAETKKTVEKANKDAGEAKEAADVANKDAEEATEAADKTNKDAENAKKAAEAASKAAEEASKGVTLTVEEEEKARKAKAEEEEKARQEKAKQDEDVIKKLISGDPIAALQEPISISIKALLSETEHVVGYKEGFGNPVIVLDQEFKNAKIARIRTDVGHDANTPNIILRRRAGKLKPNSKEKWGHKDLAAVKFIAIQVPPNYTSSPANLVKLLPPLTDLEIYKFKTNGWKIPKQPDVQLYCEWTKPLTLADGTNVYTSWEGRQGCRAIWKKGADDYLLYVANLIEKWYLDVKGGKYADEPPPVIELYRAEGTPPPGYYNAQDPDEPLSSIENTRKKSPKSKQKKREFIDLTLHPNGKATRRSSRNSRPLEFSSEEEEEEENEEEEEGEVEDEQNRREILRRKYEDQYRTSHGMSPHTKLTPKQAAKIQKKVDSEMEKRYK